MSTQRRKEAWLIAGLLAVYLVLAAFLPAADDEVYYWSWARPLQFSYYDHPPLTAYMIRLSTDVFGDSIFGFRVPACLASVFVIAVIAHLSRPKSLLPGIVLTPLFTVGAVLITPDTPLLCAWAAYVWWLVEVHRRLTPVAEEGPRYADASLPWWLWLIGGTILGCGVLGKYTMALAVPSGFVSFCLVWRLWKRWLPGYVLHGLVAFVVASPILIHNIQHDFVPLLFQWRHTMGDSRPGLKPFGEFVGVQLLLFGTLPFFLYPWVLRNFPKLCENPRLRACACLYALPMTFFLYKATRAPLQGNWALVMFVSFWPLAAAWYESVRQSKFWRWSTASAFIIPSVCVLVLAVHVLKPLPFIPAEGDRVTRQYALNEATKQIAETIRQRGEQLPVFTPTYQMTAWLRFQSLDGRQIDQISRPSHFTQQPEHVTDVNRAYVVADFPLPAEFAEGFDPPELIGDYPILIRGEKVRDLQLLLYSKKIAARKHEGPHVALVSHQEEAAIPLLLSEEEPREWKPTETTDYSLSLLIAEVQREDLEKLKLDDHFHRNVFDTERCDEKWEQLDKAGCLTNTSRIVIPLHLSQTSEYFNGGEFAVPVPNADGQYSTEWRKYGFEFNVTPLAFEKDRVKLQCFLCISQIDNANAITLNNVLIPGISRRRVQSTMNWPDKPSLMFLQDYSKDRRDLLIRHEFIKTERSDDAMADHSHCDTSVGKHGLRTEDAASTKPEEEQTRR